MPEHIPVQKVGTTQNQPTNTPNEAALKDLVGWLEKGRPQIALLEPSLDKNISEIVERAAKPGLQTDVEFKTKLASALRDYEKLAGPLNVESGTREELGRLTTTSPASEISRTNEPQKLNSNGETGLKDIVAQLAQGRPLIAQIDDRIGRNIDIIVKEMSRSGELANPDLKTKIAYAVQDYEKIAGPLNMPSPLREDLKALAVSVAGLENPRMKDILQYTAVILDSKLNADIRITAAEIAIRPSQDSEIVSSRLDVLENRLHLARTTSPIPLNAGAPSAPADLSRPDAQPQANQEREASHAPHQRAAGDAKAPPPEAPYTQSNPSADAISQIRLPVPAFLGKVMSALQTGQPPTPPPWDGPQTPMADRVDSFEQKMQIRRDEKSFQAAESVGADALQAIRAFTNGPGASIMTKIEDAAKANPGGMQAVLSEMRNGGRYAELREQFNSALVAEKGFSAAYDKATAGLGQYGDQRTGLEQIFGRRNDAAAVAGRFEKLDAEIGQAAAALPGKEDGKSALEEMARKAAELLAKAVEAVRSLFGHGADAGHRGVSLGAGI